jgi:hypothetical protein
MERENGDAALRCEMQARSKKAKARKHLDAASNAQQSYVFVNVLGIPQQRFMTESRPWITHALVIKCSCMTLQKQSVRCLH